MCKSHDIQLLSRDKSRARHCAADCVCVYIRTYIHNCKQTGPLLSVNGTNFALSHLSSSLLFFLFGEKIVVCVSCLSLFSIYRKEFSCVGPYVILEMFYVFPHVSYSRRLPNVIFLLTEGKSVTYNVNWLRKFAQC